MAASLSQTSGTAEKAKIDQIVSEFFAKTLHVILESRVPFMSAQSPSDDLSHLSAGSASSPRSSKASNQWFSLEFDDCPAVLKGAEQWRQGGSVEPMVVDVLLQQPMGGDTPSPPGMGPRYYFKGTSPGRGNSSGGSWSGDSCASPSGISPTVLERWFVQYEPRQKGAGIGGGLAKGSSGSGLSASTFPSTHVVETPVVYKRTVIMLRSLYCTMRTLPAHRLFRLVNSPSHGRSFSLSYKVSSAPRPVYDKATMLTHGLTPVETMWGRLCVSVAYRPTASVTAFESTPKILSTIIPDYVGSPTTERLKRFVSVGSLPGGNLGRGIQVIRPSSVPNAPSGPDIIERHSSWSVGERKYPQSSSSAPSSRISQTPSPSQPRDFHRSPQIHFFPPHHPSLPMHPSPVHPSSSLSPKSSANSPFPPVLSPRTSPSHPSRSRPSTSQPYLSSVGTSNASQPISIRMPGRSPPFSPSPSPSPPTRFSYPFTEGSGIHDHRSAPLNIPPRPSSSLSNRNASPRQTTAADYSTQSKVRYPPSSSQNVDNVSRNLSDNLLMSDQMRALEAQNVRGGVSPTWTISNLAESSLPHPYNQAADEKEGGTPSGAKISVYSLPRARSLGPKNEAGSQEDPDDGLFVMDDYRSSRMDRSAAAGALVRKLQSAPSLRHATVPAVVLGSPSPRPSFFPTAAGQGLGKVKASPPLPNRTRSGNVALAGSHSSQVSGGKVAPRTVALALEELKGYIEMRDHMRRQSGDKFQPSSPAKVV